jgi:hypothetical protein
MKIRVVGTDTHDEAHTRVSQFCEPALKKGSVLTDIVKQYITKYYAYRTYSYSQHFK